jgi:hypothetical protein
VRLPGGVSDAGGGGTVDHWLVCVWPIRLVLVAVWLAWLLWVTGWPG